MAGSLMCGTALATGDKLQSRPRHKACRLPAVRQHAFPARQPECALRPRADAEPAQLRQNQRNAAVQRPHAADFAHFERHPDIRNRRLSDRVGAGAIANSFNYYNASTQVANHFSSSFVYWTNQLSADTSPGADTSYILLSETGHNAPAPWVAYTRAGCDVAAAGIADIDLENNSTDLITTYGSGSAEYNVGHAGTGIGTADFEGIALHCAQGSAICAAANALSGTTNPDGLPVSKAVADVLPDEPNGLHRAFREFSATATPGSRPAIHPRPDTGRKTLRLPGQPDRLSDGQRRPDHPGPDHQRFPWFRRHVPVRDAVLCGNHAEGRRPP
ncbi:MAG: hypothetical protein WDN04_10130 [Rhodospirillales bacterium]